MKQDKKITSNLHIIYPFFLMLLLTIGVFITVHQSDKRQNLNSHAAEKTSCSVTLTQLDVKAQEQVLFGEINQYRTNNNINHLLWDTTLKQSSAWLSADMLKSNILSHVDSLGRAPDRRLSDCGYTITNGYGESIAEGATDARVVFNIWKNDPEHNKLMLDPRYTIAGIALEITPSGNAFWTMDFGTNAH